MTFLKRGWNRDFKLGKRKKKKRVWKKPKGRHNKMREKRKGYPPVVSIGYKNKGRKNIILIENMGDLSKVKNTDVVVLGKIGKKKKLEIIKKALENKIKIRNINSEKFIKLNTKKKEDTKK
jgi:large subunit ribosomal protein L32e